MQPYRTAIPETGVQVEWSSIAGRIYTLQHSDRVLEGYTNLVTGIAANTDGGTSGTNSYLHVDAGESMSHFYRLLVE